VDTHKLACRAALAALLLPAAAFAQTDFSKVEIKTTKLSDTTYMMEGSGGNLGLSIGDDAVFLIDDQFAPLTEKIKAAIAKISPRPVRFVLNTHLHFDHTGGNENFGNAGAVIVAHENVRKRMSSEQVIELFKQTIPASPRAALPIVSFATSVTFNVNGDEIRAIHVAPAHTDGDSIVYFVKSDVVHMGDTYFNGMYPFIDTSSGGRIDGMIAACDMVLGFVSDKTRIIPGHGPLSNKAELAAYREMLATVASRIRRLVADGKTPEEIVAANVTADLDAKWGNGFLKAGKFTEMVALNLIKNR
jgi:glyoxylase-like metal-dependent hydrolase (beta-lactamase superfamily II)